MRVPTATGTDSSAPAHPWRAGPSARESRTLPGRAPATYWTAQTGRTARIGVLVASAALALTLSGCASGSGDDAVSPGSGISSSGSGSPAAADASEKGSGSGESSDGTDVLALPPSPSASNDMNWWPAQPKTLATGAKLPDDYEPATLEHPARNVPKPVMPKEAKQETEAGAQAFLNYRADAQWYSIQTGDTALIKELTATECERCNTQYEGTENLYRGGGWAAGGMEIYKIMSGSLIKRPEGYYSSPVAVDTQGLKVIEDSKVSLQQMPQTDDSNTDINLMFKDGKWIYVTASPRGEL